MTTSCTGSPRLPSSAATAQTMAPSLPTPSPPPTTSTVFRSACRPSSRRAAAPRRRCTAKSCRTGSPWRRSWASVSPLLLAARTNEEEGTKQRSTPGCSHSGCAAPRSVTTVTNGTRPRASPPLAPARRRGLQRTLMPRRGGDATEEGEGPSWASEASACSGTVWQSGCIEMTRSGSCCAMHARMPLLASSRCAELKRKRVGGNAEVRYMVPHRSGRDCMYRYCDTILLKG
mmetsp:Transcript_44363/g.143100  ORF Transcript_44363/g.143100 Transcript_44363/m.143100 type:complete len:231 (+) Transcript_44363:642-1334(+)